MAPSRRSPARSRVVAGAVLVGVVVAGVVVALGRGSDRPVTELPPGRHQGITITEPTVLRAAPGAVVEGPLRIRSDDVRVEGVVVEGGETAVSVRDAGDVVLDGIVVRGSPFGIDANDAHVEIRDCVVTGLGPDGGQAIEIRNSNGRARSVVRGCRVASAMEGIVSHVSRVEFRDNEVTGTGMRGIAVTEMSEGLVEGNVVRDAVGAAIYCGDMSHCEVRGNRVSEIAADPHGIRSRSGSAVAAWYYSTVRVHGNDFDVAADPAVDVYAGSVEVERFPLSHWPRGWQGAALPGLWVTLMAIAVVIVLRVLARPVARRLAARWSSASSPSASRTTLGRDLLITTFVVQILHVGEHVVQVWQVHAADAEIRKGLAGQWFDTEWLHLGFNGVVLGGLAGGAWLYRHELARRFGPLLAWLLAAVVVQSWHVAEHVVRVVQYLDSGVSPAPGIIGDDLGLVWFHFGINVSVIAGISVAVARLLVGGVRLGADGGLSPSPRLRHA